ncbi:MAG: magnesium transporter [Gammaproteobacteria bacterium]|nr:magnesium transporter [Gammaproteobacteria bacterium]
MTGKTSPKTSLLQQIHAFDLALNRGTLKQVREMLNTLPPGDVAYILQSTPPKNRKLLWALIEDEQGHEVLQYLDEEVRTTLVSEMKATELASIVEHLDTDDLADLLQELPDAVIQEVLGLMKAQDRERVEAVLSYPEESAGGLMNTDTLTVRPDVTVEVVLRYLQLQGEIPEHTDQLFVVDRVDHYLGSIHVTKLLTQKPTTPVKDIMEPVEVILASLPQGEVAQFFERHNLISAPVVNDEGKLLGRITIDDILNVVRDEAEHSLMGMAGLGEFDTFAPILTSTRRRAIWLGINLLTAIIAAGVIKIFEHTLEQVVALAVLMPVVASMGGIAGTQTLMLVIRAMALGQVRGSNVGWLFNKELMVGVLNGFLWAVVMGGVAVIWFDNLPLGFIIAAALTLNLVVAAFSGVCLPLLLRKLKIDPAVSGGVILTTITDVVGFFLFLGLGTVFLL